MVRALAETLDRQAITEVFSRYAGGVDRRDPILYRSCFTDTLDIDMSGRRTPNVAAEAWVEQALGLVASFESTQHFITNHRIELAGDEAWGSADLQAQHWRPDGYWLVIGRYRDRFVRTADGWRISELSLEIDWSEQTGSARSPRPGRKGSDA